MHTPGSGVSGLIRCWCWYVAAVLSAAAAVPDAAAGERSRGQQMTVYVGTYTGNTGSRGIYIFRMRLDDGVLEPIASVGGVENPSFLALHPDGHTLYCVEEIADAGQDGAGNVAAFAIDRTNGGLQFLNRQSSGGGHPCHLVVDQAGAGVLVANYSGGSVAALPIRRGGYLEPIRSFHRHRGSGPNTARQSAPHAHSINLDPENRFAFAADLGTDSLVAYRYQVDRVRLQPDPDRTARLAPGAGPRHFCFHPTGRFVYVINELDLTVTVMAYDPREGRLEMEQTIPTVPPDVDRSGLSTAEVRVHPTGRFLYGSNRGHDTIVVYAIDVETGHLSLVEHEPTQGRAPRNFFIDPTGTFLLAENRASNSIVVFRIDEKTGALEATGHRVEVPSPVCIRMLRRGD